MSKYLIEVYDIIYDIDDIDDGEETPELPDKLSFECDIEADIDDAEDFEYEITNIATDIDDAEDLEYKITNIASDFISDETGFCHLGFKMKFTAV